jgi:hypothetical protein
LNSLKEIVLDLLLNFSILQEELMTSMVYMGVEVIVCNGIYGDGMKVCTVTGVPTDEPLQMDFDVQLM